MKYAALDLGSNSFHLLVARTDRRGRLERIETAKHMVRLGAGTLRTGRLDDAAWARGMTALDMLVDTAREHSGCRLVGVATSALREAENGRKFVREARARFGVEIEIISGEEEARLVYLGARSELPLDARVAVVDIGGGSVEIAIGQGAEEPRVFSLPLGVLRLREAVVPEDGYVSMHTAETIATVVRGRAAEATAAVRKYAPDLVVFTSGTARTVAALARDLNPARSEGNGLDRDTVARLMLILSKFRPSAMGDLGVEAGRADTIATGTVVVHTLLESLGVREATISRRALREGVVLRELERSRRTVRRRASGDRVAA